MRPKSEPKHPQRELFQLELDQIIDLRHPRVRLGQCINWSSLEEALGSTYHPTHGAAGVPTRLMVALHYLKYQHDLSDENVLAHWLENPYWQHFSGERYFPHRLPVDASSMTRWRERLVKAARREGLVVKQSYRHVGKRLLLASSRYAHARQMKRARAATRSTPCFRPQR